MNKIERSEDAWGRRKNRRKRKRKKEKKKEKRVDGKK